MFSPSSNGISPFSQLSPFMNWMHNPSSSSQNHHENSPFQEDLLSLYFSNNNIVAPTVDKNVDKVCRIKPKKTDRHSKICTAQGPRDRRVRLSIDISKKFFGLQDLLGFDKASLTLDWLLTKSKTAIQELLREKNIDISKDGAFLCSLSEDGDNEVEEAEADDGTSNVVASKETPTASKRKLGKSRAKNRKPQMISASDKAAKESREKARQRARERTRLKISLRNILGVGPSPEQSLFSPANNYQWPSAGQIGSSISTDSSRQSTPSTDPVEGFFFVNPRTGEVNNIVHQQEDAFSESARLIKTKLDFNLWMNQDDLF